MPNLTNTLAFNGKEAREYILIPAFALTMDNDVINFVQGIKAKEQLAFLSLMYKITRKDSGCNTPTPRGAISRSEKFWDPEMLEAFWDYCATNGEDQLEVYAKAAGYKYFDLSADEQQAVLAQMLIQRHNEAMADDLQRIYWLGDKSVIAGDLSAGAAVADYDQVNGLWVRIATGVTGTTIAHHDITALQAGALTDDNDPLNYEAPTILKELHKKADLRLRNLPNNQKIYLVSESIFDNLVYYYQSKGITLSLESGVEAEKNGVTSLMYNGVEVRKKDIWDRWINTDWAPAGTVDRPHRAIYTAKQNLAVGFDSRGAAEDFQMWYERKDKKNYVQANYKMDTLIEFDFYVAAAY